MKQGRYEKKERWNEWAREIDDQNVGGKIMRRQRLGDINKREKRIII